MATYLITYDLHTPGQQYNRLYDAIKELGDWRHALQNMWLVKTSYTAIQIRDFLKTKVDGNDEIFIELVDNWASWNMPDIANWLKS